jgi:hypothetical protein
VSHQQDFACVCVCGVDFGNYTSKTPNPHQHETKKHQQKMNPIREAARE